METEQLQANDLGQIMWKNTYRTNEEKSFRSLWPPQKFLKDINYKWCIVIPETSKQPELFITALFLQSESHANTSMHQAVGPSVLKTFSLWAVKPNK